MPVLISSNFEDATAQGWTAGTNTAASSTDRAAGGTRSLKATKTGAIGNLQILQPNTPVTAGAMTVTFSAGQSAALAGGIFCDLLPGYLFLEPAGGLAIAAASIPSVGMSATITRTFTVPAGYTSVDLYLRLDTAAVGDVFYVDDVIMSQGTANIAPTANAGPDQNVAVGQVVTLTGSGVDSDGTIASYAWTFPTRPAASTAVLAGTGTTRTFTADVAGTYTASLTVTDNSGAVSAADTVNVVAAALTGPWVRVAGVYVQTPAPLVRVAGVYV